MYRVHLLQWWAIALLIVNDFEIAADTDRILQSLGVLGGGGSVTP